MRLVTAATPVQPDRDEASALARRAATGDVDATAALLKRLAPGIVRAAHALMGSTHADVDDVVQKSLIALVQALPAFRGECSPAHYAQTIVTRTAMAARRRDVVKGERQDADTELDALEADAPSQSDEVLAEQRRRLVRQLLQALPEVQAETLAMRVVFGFSLEEVAAATGVPVNTVRSRVRLAKEALKRQIDRTPGLLAALGGDE